jgi:hypothetical protein
MGRFRTVALINLAGRAAMLPVMVFLLQQSGLHGLAVSRLCVGSVALLVYVPLGRVLFAGLRAAGAAPGVAVPFALQESSK